MKFWDASAVVPLCLEESTSGAVRRIFDEDPNMVVWWGTRPECVSAFIRRVRDGSLRSADERNAREVFRSLAQSWTEIQPSEELRSTVESLLAIHQLRTADAFQLAAAITWCRGLTAEHNFVVFDRRLRVACEVEGFSVLPEKF